MRAGRTGLASALLIIAAPLHAQGYIARTVLDSATITPLACLEVSLVDTAGRMIERQLTNGEGVFQLDAPPKGTYRLRCFASSHDPMYGPIEDLEPTMERARVQIVRSSHRDFTEVVLKYLEKVEYQPARMEHRPVCALARDWPFRFTVGHWQRPARRWRSRTHLRAH